jgi:flagellar biosynthetic protein FliP
VTFGSMMGVLMTLGFVLALLGIALKLLRRFAPTSTTNARVRMEVVQRLALGPKQGIAVIRVGERLVAVSVGEGGINRLFELEESEIATAAGEASAQRSMFEVDRSRAPLDFKAVLTSALRTAGLGLVLVAALAGSATIASAQAVTARPPSAQQIRQIAADAVTGSRAGQSPADMVQKLAGAAMKGAGTAKGAQTAADIPKMDLRMGSGDGLHLSGTVGVVVMMGLLTLLPTLLLMMTGFTRILIVLNFLKQALGTQSAPPNQLVAALALLLTGFVMAPTLSELNRTALTPWMNGQIDQSQMMELGARPFRAFMLKQTRRQDIETFVRMSGSPAPSTVNDVPLVTLTSAFVISELRTSFQIGFALFLPFIVIDVAVSSVLMSMGMFMLPPAMISLPFKLLLFVLVDGWSLIVQSLITSFR